jgi:2-polyprenyl-6-methoxyphenol hydroxylase-like FAD-dependent oxidoreductase
VGAGPGGAVLALLLTRQGLNVTLLEAQWDFDRDFRGDALSPAVMEIMAEMGLAEDLLKLRHARIQRLSVQTARGPVTLSDFSRLKTAFPYMTVLPQARFLEHITAEAARFPGFRLILGANVQGLLERDGRVCGVRYRSRNGWHEVEAPLTVGADGRASRVRHLAGFETVSSAPPMDVLWFRLPRHASDPESANLSVRFGRGFYLALIDCFDHWKISYVIPKGTFAQVKEAGLTAFQQTIAEAEPLFADRLEAIASWGSVSVLSVGSSRVLRWFSPGLLLIGDAAHVMSSVGGVGIQCAIQDAVVAAAVLQGPLLKGTVDSTDLAAVQRRREWPTRLTQAIQAIGQRQVIARALDPDRAFSVPVSLRLPLVRDLATRFTAFGVWPVHVRA